MIANPPGKLSTLLYLASKLGGIDNKISDGVVTRDSALLEGWEPLDDWPLDHTEIIGLNLDNLITIPSGHIDRYMELISNITGKEKHEFYKPAKKSIPQSILSGFENIIGRFFGRN